MSQSIRSFLMGALEFVLGLPCSAARDPQNVQSTSAFTGESLVPDDNINRTVGNEMKFIRNSSRIRFLNISTVGPAAVTIAASGTSDRVKVGFARSSNGGAKRFSRLRFTKKLPT